MAASIVTVNGHTTSSTPRPHILYTVHFTHNGERNVVYRRYSEFISLHDTLKDRFSLPPKRLLVTSFLPSAWADDALITERKAGLTTYLSDLLKSPEHTDHPALQEFLASQTTEFSQKFDVEDALPSTLSRKEALSPVSKAQGYVDAQAEMVAGAYYPDWSAWRYPPEGLDFSKFDIIFYAFVTPNASSTLTWDSGSQEILQRLVKSARASGKGTKIVLSVGGWGGSYWFSQACSNSTNRTKLVDALLSAVNTYGLHGVDIDWEYPNSAGAGNPNSPSDAANLLSFFKSLRSALGSSKIISAAVPHLPWLGSNGQPLTNASAYAAQLTYVNIMNYDVWGASANPGPNAPLGNLCGTSTQPQASAQAALAQWKAAGFPASKLLLGLPLYGYVSQSTKTKLTGSFMSSDDMLLLHKSDVTNLDTGIADTHFLNGKHVRAKEVTTAAAAKADLTAYWGQQVAFNKIVASGALVKKSNGTYGEGGGFTMAWDDCSNTPFLFNTSQRTVVTYDDTWSLGDKASFAKKNGMAGCFTWSLDQDDGLTLHNAIRAGLGK